MNKDNINVLRFFLLLNALPIESKLGIMKDPTCCDALTESVPNGMVDVTEGIVYNLYMYHSHVFTAAMVTPEVSWAMWATFDRGEWTEKCHRPSLTSIAAARRSILMGGRP